MSSFELSDYQDSGWPFPVMSANEIALTNCPNLVLPAEFKTRDTILIEDGKIKVMVVFDGAVLVNVMGVVIPHIVAQQMVGKRLSNLLDVSQLRNHPVPSMTIATVDVLEDGLDIDLSNGFANLVCAAL